MLKAWQKLQRVHYNLDAGGGGGGAAAAGGEGGAAAGSANPFGASGGAAAAGGEGGAAAAGAAGQPYFPDKFPDHLRGGSDKETIDKLYGAFSGMRTEMATRGAVPKDSNGYDIKISEDLQKVFGDLSKDRGVGIFKNLALKHGLTDKQAAGFFQDYHAEALTAGLVKTVDVQAEAKKILGDSARGLDDQALMQQAGVRWQGTMDWIDGLERSQAISKEQAQAGKAIAETADGVLFLEAVAKTSREHGLQAGGAHGVGGQLTKAELDARVADPRNSYSSPQYNADFALQTDTMFKSFYGASGRQ